MLVYKTTPDFPGYDLRDIQIRVSSAGKEEYLEAKEPFFDIRVNDKIVFSCDPVLDDQGHITVRADHDVRKMITVPSSDNIQVNGFLRKHITHIPNESRELVKHYQIEWLSVIHNDKIEFCVDEQYTFTLFAGKPKSIYGVKVIDELARDSRAYFKQPAFTIAVLPRTDILKRKYVKSSQSVFLGISVEVVSSHELRMLKSVDIESNNFSLMMFDKSIIRFTTTRPEDDRAPYEQKIVRYNPTLLTEDKWDWNHICDQSGGFLTIPLFDDDFIRITSFIRPFTFDDGPVETEDIMSLEISDPISGKKRKAKNDRVDSLLCDLNEDVRDTLSTLIGINKIRGTTMPDFLNDMTLSDDDLIKKASDYFDFRTKLAVGAIDANSEYCHTADYIRSQLDEILDTRRATKHGKV
jgi:hypothetical protein